MASKSDRRLIIIQRLWRKQTTWTQRQAAHILDISQPAFNQYLRGTIPLNLSIIIKFANFFGVQPKKIDSTLDLDEVKKYKS